MGTGRSGLPKGVTKKSTKNLTEFRVTANNYKDYNIKMESRLKKNTTPEMLNKAFDTLNAMSSMLGLDPNILPAISLGLTNRRGVYGDCRMLFDWENKPEDARIRLHPDMFADKNYDTFAHEYVHALEAWMIRTNISGDWNRVNAWIDHTYSEAICRNALFKMGKNPGATLDKAAWKTESATIKLNSYDDYASSKPAETITRAVQTVLRFGDKASPFAKSIVAELKKEVANTYKNSKKK